MNKKRFLIAPFLLLIICFGVQAQDVDFTKLPGYVDLEKIKIPDRAGEFTDISIGPALLKIVRGEDDWDREKSVSGIVSIRVKSFEVGYDEAATIRPIMDEIEEKLKKEDWELLIRVKDDDEAVNVSMKMENDKAVGLLIMGFDPGDDVVFVNIVGRDLSLRNLGNIHLGSKCSAFAHLLRKLELF